MKLGAMVLPLGFATAIYSHSADGVMVIIVCVAACLDKV